MTAMVRARGIAGYPALVRSLNADPLPLLRRHHIAPDSIDDEDALLPVHSVVTLLEASAATTGCPDFGLRLSQVQDISVLGPIAVAMQNSPTVADALQFASAHLFVQSPALVFTVVPDSHLVPGSVELRFEMVLPREPVQRQAFDLCLGDLHRIVQFLAHDRYELKAASLPHTPIAPLKTYARFFGARVHAAQEHGGLHVSRKTLSATLQAVNESLRQIAVDYLEANFGDPAQTVASRVRLAIRRTLSSTQGRKEAIADLLGMHQRTLQRRLDVEKTSFEDIREEVRKQTALRYLCETRIPLTQLASLLGLSEQSALTRSCRRWFGDTPSAIRLRGTKS
jgi:AraC-like DNA-binding protein